MKYTPGKNFFLLILAMFIFLTTFVLIKNSKVPQKIKSKANSEKIGVRIGVVHVGGEYPDRLTQEDFLLYGAEDALNLGFQSIEIFVDPRVCRARPSGAYQTLKYCKPEKDTEVKGDSLVSLASEPDFKKILDMPFKRFNLTVDTVNPAGVQQWELGGPQGAKIEPPLLTKQQLDATFKDFYDFTSYLLQAYQGSGKLFIFINPSELDWHLTAFTGCRNKAYDGDDTACMNEEASQNAITNEINYLNTVADAIAKAKEDNPATGIKIYHACEVNQVLRRSMRNKKSAMTDVLPKTRCEIVAYSAHEARREAVKINDPQIITSVLDFIEMKMPDHPTLGSRNIIISEIGFQEAIPLGEEFETFYTELIRETLNWGIPYIQVWQMYQDGNGKGILGIRGKDLNLTQTYDVLYKLGRKK